MTVMPENDHKRPGTLIIGLDPGYKESAYVEFLPATADPGTGGIRVHHKGENEWILRLITANSFLPEYQSAILVVEQMQMFRSAWGVGAEVFDSQFWAGRFVQAWSPRRYERIIRAKVRGHLQAIKGGDAAVRQGLIVRFGGYKDVAIGTKKAPGPLYGIKADEWSALALAVTWSDLNVRTPRKLGPIEEVEGF